MYLGAKLFKALSESPGGMDVQPYTNWLNKLDQQFTNDHDDDSSLSNVGDLLMAQLEVSQSNNLIVWLTN